nr:fimbrial biogenesis outer membrane usher protein [Salmonella enterica subsp. diarizonae]
RTGGYRSTETSLRHDVAALRGQLTVGDFSTGGELMENVSLRGVRLASDDRMLPGSLRGYAPVVHGIAGSNAKVTIRQNGNIIYETTVPAGPFTVNDLYPSGYGGDLTVSVTEANGQTRLFTVPFASVAQLVRPGYTRYQVSTGRYRYADNNLDEIVFQGT